MSIRISVALLVLLFVVASCSGKTNTSPGKHLSGPTFEVSWNNHCDTYNFTSNEGVGETTTLGDLYLGSDFPTDISWMDIAISADLGAASGLAGASSNDLCSIFYDPFGDIND